MPAPKGPRPITVALNIVKRAKITPIAGAEYALSGRSYFRLLKLLTDANAASGTTDARSAQRRRRTIAKRKAPKFRPVANAVLRAGSPIPVAPVMIRF